MRRLQVQLAVSFLLLLASPLPAQQTSHAFTGARILPIGAPPIENGVLLIQGGKIVGVGSPANVTIPEGAVRHEMSGKTIMPGLVDTHSHVGEGAGADGSGPIQPDVRIIDAINPRDASIQKAQAGGITTSNVMPGSGHLLSGQTVYLKLRDGSTIDDLLIKTEDGSYAYGIKMANGTNPMKAAPFPGTRAKSAALVREQFVKAQQYRDKIRKAGNDQTKMPDRDLGLETLVDVLDGRRTVHHHTHRHDDVLTVLRIAKEFGYRVVLHHVSEGWKVATEIAAAGVPASIIVIDSPGGKLEAQDLSIETGAIMEKAGVLVAFHTDDGITDSRVFLRSAALGVRGGMSRDKALEGVTLAGAKILGLEARVGSLESGKDADFVVLSGDPLSTYTKVLETWVEGKKVFDRSNPQDRLWAVGGFGAGQELGEASFTTPDSGGVR
ncbi:MAG TPA: amidohydrolase family protein [Thermoanaerobaculia bacterium]|nr:amidohydrolase family protein [Thermoanaerobaculia bacterium]